MSRRDPPTSCRCFPKHNWQSLKRFDFLTAPHDRNDYRVWFIVLSFPTAIVSDSCCPVRLEFKLQNILFSNYTLLPWLAHFLNHKTKWDFLLHSWSRVGVRRRQLWMQLWESSILYFTPLLLNILRFLPAASHSLSFKPNLSLWI